MGHSDVQHADAGGHRGGQAIRLGVTAESMVERTNTPRAGAVSVGKGCCVSNYRS